MSPLRRGGVVRCVGHSFRQPNDAASVNKKGYTGTMSDQPFPASPQTLRDMRDQESKASPLAAVGVALSPAELEDVLAAWDKDRAEIERLKEGLQVIADPEYRPGEHSYTATKDGQRIPNSERIAPSRQVLGRNLLESNNGG